MAYYSIGSVLYINEDAATSLSAMMSI